MEMIVEKRESFVNGTDRDDKGGRHHCFGSNMVEMVI